MSKKRANKPSNNRPLQVMETPTSLVQEDHRLIIDEYFSNGMNGTKAVQEYRPDITYQTARVVWNQIQNTEHGKKYINEKRQRLRATTAIAGEQIARALLTYASSDATAYIGLTAEELKALPNEIKQCIQAIKINKKTFKDRQGRDVTEETISVRIVDKLKAIDMINKHIGFYSGDNAQKHGATKAVSKVLEGANTETLKALANIAKLAEDAEEAP